MGGEEYDTPETMMDETLAYLLDQRFECLGADVHAPREIFVWIGYPHGNRWSHGHMSFFADQPSRFMG